MALRCIAQRVSLLSPGGRLPALWRTLASGAGAEEGAELQAELGELRDALEEAVASAETVGASAQQLLLETDPAARGPREQYERHYGELALIQLHAALDLAKHLRSRLGDEAAEALLRRERLALPLVDAMLWRDRTAAALDASQRRAEANEVICDS
ncbi:hypothetical protein ABPG75_013335 [Micractinium tetrahymenae]